MVDDSQTINNCRPGAVLFLSVKERKIFLGKDMESEMIMRIFDFCLKLCHLTLFSPHPFPQPIYSPNRTDRGLFQSSHLFETRCFWRSFRWVYIDMIYTAVLSLLSLVSQICLFCFVSFLVCCKFQDSYVLVWKPKSARSDLFIFLT